MTDPGAHAAPGDARLALALLAALLLVTAVALGTGAAGWSWPLIKALRIPRVLAGAGAGALLAQAGLALQLLLRNPLADPYVLGASSGGGFGAIVVLVLWGGPLWLGSVGGAMAALGLLLWIGRRSLASPHDEASAQLILIGAMLSALFGAGSTLLLALVPAQSLRGAVFWLVGDLSGARWGWALCLLAMSTTIALRARAHALDRMALGAEHAWLLGEQVGAIRVGLVLLAALATGAVVAQAGALGFVGLVAPHLLRLRGVVRMRQQAWAAPLLGATMVVAADTVARLIVSPYELPVGAITALLGAPLFIVLLGRQSR